MSSDMGKHGNSIPCLHSIAWRNDSPVHLLPRPRGLPFGAESHLRRKSLSQSGNCQNRRVLMISATSVMVQHILYFNCGHLSTVFDLSRG